MPGTASYSSGYHSSVHVTASALHAAIKAGHSDCVCVLVDFGAEPSIPMTKNGTTVTVAQLIQAIRNEGRRQEMIEALTTTKTTKEQKEEGGKGTSSIVLMNKF